MLVNYEGAGSHGWAIIVRDYVRLCFSRNEIWKLYGSALCSCPESLRKFKFSWAGEGVGVNQKMGKRLVWTLL